MRINQLMALFGVKMPEHYRIFILEHDMEWLYKDARKSYLTQIKSCHPDKTGEGVEKAIVLNQCWAAVERWYRIHFPSVVAPRIGNRLNE